MATEDASCMCLCSQVVVSNHAVSCDQCARIELGKHTSQPMKKKGAVVGVGKRSMSCLFLCPTNFCPVIPKSQAVTLGSQPSIIFSRDGRRFSSHMKRQIILSHLDTTETFSRQGACAQRNREPSIPALCSKYHPQGCVLLADEEDASHLGRARGQAQ